MNGDCEYEAAVFDTVAFDVGGTIHRVARSTILRFKKTMLSTMIKDAWLENQTSRKAGEDQCQKEVHQDKKQKSEVEVRLFIDRNGELFKYVVEYMRCGSVDLPSGVSKAAVMKDLDYYLFKVRDGDVRTNDEEAARSARSWVVEQKETIKRMEKQLQVSRIGLKCVSDFNRLVCHPDEEVGVEIVSSRVDPALLSAHFNETDLPDTVELLNEFLKGAGLQYSDHDDFSVDVKELPATVSM